MLQIRALLFLLLSFSLSSFAYADPHWSIIKKDNKYFLENSSKKISHPLHFNGTPLLENVKVHDTYTYVEYNSGEYGTTEMVTIHRRVVIGLSGKVLGDHPYRYESECKDEKQPVWLVVPKKREIQITDPDSYFHTVIKY